MVSLRDYVQAMVEAERKIRISEREDDLRAIDKAFMAQEKLAEKHNNLLAQMDQKDKSYVTERMYTERHAQVVELQDRIQERMDKMEGGRRALGVVAAVVVTVILAAFGLVYGHQLSSQDVAAQIQIESPWLQDKPGVTGDIAKLQVSEAHQDEELSRVAALDKFFCDTRHPPLSGCSAAGP